MLTYVIYLIAIQGKCYFLTGMLIDLEVRWGMWTNHLIDSLAEVRSD